MKLNSHTDDRTVRVFTANLMFKKDERNNIIKKLRKCSNNLFMLSSPLVRDQRKQTCFLTLLPGVQGTNTQLNFWALQFPEKLTTIVNDRNTRNILKAITDWQATRQNVYLFASILLGLHDSPQVRCNREWFFYKG